MRTVGGFGTKAARRVERCTCPRSNVAEGEWIEWPDADCPEHGRGDEWRANDPLRRHARMVDLKTGEALTHEDARARLRSENPAAFSADGITVYIDCWMARFRDETPREAEARLLAERSVRVRVEHREHIHDERKP